jgi:hypothetical protein
MLWEITEKIPGLLDYLMQVFLNENSSFQNSRISRGLWTNWNYNPQK